MNHKVVTLFLAMFLMAVPVYPMAFGSYNSEEEYGILDGLKFNWSRKDKSEKFIDVNEPEKKDKKEKTRDMPEDIYLRNLIENRTIL